MAAGVSGDAFDDLDLTPRSQAVPATLMAEPENQSVAEEERTHVVVARPLPGALLTARQAKTIVTRGGKPAEGESL